MASLSLRLLLLSLFVVVCVLPLTSTAPQAWRPQGRFGKRAAWRPQSRFGKRPSSTGISAFRGDRGPKRAWRPSSRFGKRGDGEEEMPTDVSFGDVGALKRAWKPQGRFGKRGDEAEVDMMAGEEEKRAWKPQGRFGKRLRTQRWKNMIDALKRAWKPQGRFGKRADISSENEEQDALNAVSMDEDVFVDQQTGETCIQAVTEDGTPVYRCFQRSAEGDVMAEAPDTDEQ